MLIVDWTCRTGQIVNLIHLDIEREGHIMTHHLVPGVAMQMVDVAFGAGEIIVDTDHLVPLIQQTVGQMRADKAGPASDQNAFAAVV